MKTQKKIRLNLDLSPTVKAQLDQLQLQTEAASLTEVIRRALAVYDLIVEQDKSEGSIILENADGTRERLRIV